MTLRVTREASREPKHTAFPYQVAAVEAVKALPYAALFHEQGLGKTKIAIDLALTWLAENVVDSVLLVTKKSLVENWRQEVSRHSHITPRVLGQDRRANYLALNSPARFYLTHYEACVSERSRLGLFLRARRVAVICDEAHKFKNPDSEIAKALFALSKGFQRRVVMTGTPVANRPYDLWALVYFLDGGLALGADFRAFKRELDLTADLRRDEDARDAFEAALSGLFDRVRSFTVRETKGTAGLNLPTKTIVNIPVDAEELQHELYVRFRDETRSVVLRGNVPVLDDAEAILKRLLRLVQVASNPRLVDSGYRRVPGKLPVLEAVLGDALSQDGAKAIVWTAFTENVDWLARELRSLGSARVHGKLPIDERNRAIARFKDDPSCRVLVATPGAAKEGLTLTVANHAVFYDRSFGLDDYLQAQDRIHRISQDRPCFVYNLLMRDTVDQWVDELLGAKHLAAKLGQGDISRAEYARSATYDFAELLPRILGTEARGEAPDVS